MCIPPSTSLSDPVITVGAVLGVVGFAGRELTRRYGSASKRLNRRLRWMFVGGVVLATVGVAVARLASRCGTFG